MTYIKNCFVLPKHNLFQYLIWYLYMYNYIKIYNDQFKTTKVCYNMWLFYDKKCILWSLIYYWCNYFHTFCYIEEKETTKNLKLKFGFAIRKIWAFIWYQKIKYFRLSPGGWEYDRHNRAFKYGKAYSNMKKNHLYNSI